MAKLHLNVKKVSLSSGMLKAAYGHNTRTNAGEDWSHIDPTKTDLNHDLVNPTNVPYRDLVDNRIREAGIAAGKGLITRADAVIALTVYCAYTHGAEEENGFTPRQWEEATLEWLQAYFGRENVVSAMVHMDESSPHIHAIIVPITKDLRLCAKEFTDAECLSRMHRSYAEALSGPPFYMDPPKQHVRKGAHNGIKEFYSQINEIEELQLPEKEAEETLDAYLGRLRTYVQKIERRQLAEKMQLNEKIDHLNADIRGMRIDYKQALNLRQYLIRLLGNAGLADAELLRLYRFEQYPREAIDLVFEKLEQEYGTPSQEQELFFTQKRQL